MLVISTSCEKDGTEQATTPNIDDQDKIVIDSITDIDGNVYFTVEIGSQTWIAENLKTTKYSNGDAIQTTPHDTTNIMDETNPKYQWAYEGDNNNSATYGLLYTWHAVTDDRGEMPHGLARAKRFGMVGTYAYCK